MKRTNLSQITNQTIEIIVNEKTFKALNTRFWEQTSQSPRKCKSVREEQFQKALHELLNL